MAQLPHGVEPTLAIGLLKDHLGKIPNVMKSPPPDVEILQFTPMGPVLAVRPYCNNAHYWQVYFETNRMIREAFGNAGFPVPSSTCTSARPPGRATALRAEARRDRARSLPA